MSFSRSLTRGIARGIVYPIVEALTLALLRARMQLTKGRPQARALTSPGGQRVLVIAAHPDDETIGCAGAIMRHVAAGDAVKVLLVTDGSGSRAGGLSPQAMAQVRRREVDKLARLWSAVTFERLDYVENTWSEPDLIIELCKLLTIWQPQIIYAPSCVDFHPEHMKVGKALARAFIEYDEGPMTNDEGRQQTDSIYQDRDSIRHSAFVIRRPPTIRAYEMQVPLGIELTNLYCPLGAMRAEKDRAMGIYRSQQGALDLWKRQARYLAALYNANKGAEAFWEISPEGYCRIMARADWDWRTMPFKSLSGRPFNDLAAHTRGRAMRLELRSLARS